LKLREVDGRNAVAYDPDKEEREWAAKFLDLEEIGPDDLGEDEPSEDAD
jgi:hypothetical protein